MKSTICVVLCIHLCDQAQPCKLPIIRIKSRKEGQEIRLLYKNTWCFLCIISFNLSSPVAWLQLPRLHKDVTEN